MRPGLGLCWGPTGTLPRVLLGASRGPLGAPLWPQASFQKWLTLRVSTPAHTKQITRRSAMIIGRSGEGEWTSQEGGLYNSSRIRDWSCTRVVIYTTGHAQEALLGISWAPLGPSWGPLGPSSDPLGALLGHCRGPPGPSSAVSEGFKRAPRTLQQFLNVFQYIERLGGPLDALLEPS